MECVDVDTTTTGKVFLSFYNVRPHFEAEYKVDEFEDGPSSDAIEITHKVGAVYAYQQGIILDVDEARSLRDKLTEILDGTE